MKLIFSENTPLYSQYLFPYSIYGIRQENDNLNNIYSGGFLPTRINHKIFYLARSVRVNLKAYKDTSELRRIARKNEGLTVESIPLNEFKYDYTLGKKMKDFYDQRFGEKTLSAQKAKWLFTSGAFTHVFKYKIKNLDNWVGYCIANISENSIHYAYPFNNSELNMKNLGMGMMLTAVEWAKENDKSYVYLGSSYTENSLYKTQFPGFEWFNGSFWNSDIKKLKQLIRDTPPINMFIEEKELRDDLINKSSIAIDFS